MQVLRGRVHHEEKKVRKHAQQWRSNTPSLLVDPFSPTPLLRPRCVRLRFYCVICSIIVFFTLLTLLVFIYGVVPLIIRSQISQSTLEFNALIIEGLPTNSSVHTQTFARIANVMEMKADMQDMVLTINLVDWTNTSDYGGLITLGSIDFPSQRLNGPTNLQVDADLEIADLSNFQHFTRTLLFADQIEWNVQGTAAVTPILLGMRFPTVSGIPFEKNVILAGCGGLQQVELVSFSMRNSTRTQLLIEATISIVNPSRFALHPIGLLNFDLYYKGFYQGSLTSLNNQTLMNGGINVIEFQGFMEPDPKHLEVTHELVALYLTGAGATVHAKAGAEASSIPLYNQALQGLVLPTFLSGLANGTLIPSVEMLGARMTPSLVDQTIDFEMSLLFTIDSPLGTEAPMTLHSMEMSVRVEFLQTTIDPNSGQETIVAVPIGQLSTHNVVPLTPWPASSTSADPSDDASSSFDSAQTFTYFARIPATLALSEPVSNYQDFVRAFLAAEGQLGMNLTGLATVSASYLYGNLTIAGVPVLNTVYMQGAQGLNQTSEQSLIVSGNRPDCLHPPCGVNLAITASIVNPSLFTLNLSNSWFDLSTNGVRLGSLQILPLFIAPGFNSDLRAVGFLNPAQQDLGELSTFISQYVNGVNHTMQLTGVMGDPSLNATRGSQPTAHQLTLASVVVPATCHGLHLESLMGDVSIHEFIFSFNADSAAAAGARQPQDDTSYAIGTTAIVQAQIVLPPTLTLPLDVLSSTVDFDVLYDVAGQGLMPLGMLNVSRFPVSYVPGSTTELLLDFTDATFNVAPEEVAAFQSFSTVILSAPHVNLTLQGAASPTANTNLGQLDLTGVPVKQTVTINGYNSFYAADGSSLVHLVHLDLISAHVAPPSPTYPHNFMGGGTIDMACNVTLTNPSQVAITQMGVLEFDVWFEGVRLVTVHLSNFSFDLGVNNYSSTCRGTFYSPVLATPWDPLGLAAQDVARKFLSDYIDGNDNQVTMVGKILQPDGSFLPGTPIPLLAPGFSAFSTNIACHGQKKAFIQKLVVEMSWNLIWKIVGAGHGIVPATAQLYNPFATALTVTHMNLTVLAGGLDGPVGGWLVQELGIQPVFIPAYGSIVSETLPVYLQLNPAVEAKLYEIMERGNTTVSLMGDIEVWIGSTGPGQPDPATVFNQTVRVAQLDVLTTASITFFAPAESHAADASQATPHDDRSKAEMVAAERESRSKVLALLRQRAQARAQTATPTTPVESHPAAPSFTPSSTPLALQPRHP